MPRINSILRLLHSNAIQVVPTIPKAMVVMQPIHKSVMVPEKPADSVVVYLEHKHFAAAFAPHHVPVQAERLDMPRPDALAIALLEQYPDHS